MVNTIVTVCVILGGLVALGTIVGWFTESGRRFRQRLAARLRRRPGPPRTSVHIEPQRQLCYWSQATARDGKPGHRIVFNMRVVATNLTPAYELQVQSVQLKGVRRPEYWHDVSSLMSLADDCD
jgi:hypothetical protein